MKRQSKRDAESCKQMLIWLMHDEEHGVYERVDEDSELRKGLGMLTDLINLNTSAQKHLKKVRDQFLVAKNSADLVEQEMATGFSNFHHKGAWMPSLVMQHIWATIHGVQKRENYEAAYRAAYESLARKHDTRPSAVRVENVEL